MRTTTVVWLFVLFVAVFANSGHSQVILESPLGFDASPVELELAPLSAAQNLAQYQQLAERLGLNDTGDMICIMRLSITNSLQVPVAVMLRDIVALTGSTRYLFSCYLVEDPISAKATYLLPNWDTVLQIASGSTMAVRFGFILREGENAAFETGLKIYGCFSHSYVEGLYHSIGLSRTVSSDPNDPAQKEPVSQIVPSVYGDTQSPHSVSFHVSEELNPISVRELRAPTTPMSRGGKCVFLERLLGDAGSNDAFPSWLGIAEAIEEGGFDYQTGMLLTDYLIEYQSAFPNGLARTAVWRRQQGILLVPTHHRVLMAVSAYPPLALPHDAAETLLFAAGEALALGLHPSDFRPEPKGYKPEISANPGEIIGFTLQCVGGVVVKAEQRGSNFEVQVTDANGTELTPLVYQRR